MNSLVIEPGLQAAENFTNSYFVKLPIDTTKNRVYLEKVSPVTTIDQTPENGSIVFNLMAKVY